MSQYIFIESRDPFACRGCRFVAETARALKESGNKVVVFLVQNGVLAARQKAVESHLPLLSGAGVTVLADEFSLRERGIQSAELGAGIKEAAIDALVDLVAMDNTKAIWH